MFSSPDKLLRQDSKSYSTALTLDEIFITRLESKCFNLTKTDKRVQYEQVATLIKKYGYGGITHLNQRHFAAIFTDLYQPSELYLHQEVNSVQQMLLTHFLMCDHLDKKSQAYDLWHLLNPQMEEYITSQVLVDTLKIFTKISVEIALTLVKQYKPKDQYQIHMMNDALKYIRNALDLKDQFFEEQLEKMPKQLDFFTFCDMVESLCFTPSQLRMAITRTEPNTVGLKVVTSLVSTEFLAKFFSDQERMNLQLVCRKWYYNFIPTVIQHIQLNIGPKPTQHFRLFSNYEGKRYYLGAQRTIKNDLREDPGPTTFVSAGCSEEYLEFSWKLDSYKRLCLAKCPESSKMTKDEAYLGAHRTFNIDIRGNCETYLLVTKFQGPKTQLVQGSDTSKIKELNVPQGHEGLWSLQRVGSLDEKRCIIQITNNKCVNDKVNHLGWCVDLPERNVSARGEPGKNWHEMNMRPARNQDSVYALLMKPTLSQLQGHQLMRVWNIEIIY